MDDAIAQFTAITSADPERAQQYLSLTDGNLEQAIQLFFDTGGVDMGATVPSQPTQAAAQTSTSNRGDAGGIISIDSDDEDERQPAGSNFEDDEAMARRLQEEAYGSGGQEEVRAPMARRTEALVGPDAAWDSGADDMRSAMAEQMMARQRRGKFRNTVVSTDSNMVLQANRPGIFNQGPTVWDDEGSDPEAHRRGLARATGGASEASAKSNLLAELFRPPFDLIAPFTWDEARDAGKEDEKWIMVNIQDPAIFDCQVLNRDIWKNASVRETIKENFIFMQYSKDDPRGDQYINYYFQQRDNDDAYPHIAIVDPRTGEQVKVWSGPPVPKPSDFLMDLHEFLDRYSLKAFAKNPVANRKPEKKTKDVEKMSEEEMLEMAMQNSLASGDGAPSKSRTADDPDALTREELAAQGTASTDAMDVADTGIPVSGTNDEVESTPFSRIPSDRPHEEATDPASSTRIQFRWSGGRIIRRFALSDTVQRIYEWLKASPPEGKEGQDFELIAMGKNLIDSLDQTIEQVGLKNGTVMVEHMEP